MNNISKRLLALTMALAMVMSLLVMPAAATEGEGGEHSHSYVDGVCDCGAVEHSHSYEAAVTAPTCTAAGFTTYTCSCGDSYTADEVAATGHSYVEGVCACGAAEHSHSYEAAVTAPTCTEAGYTTYTCSCGDSYTADEVAATGHSYVEGVCGCGAEEHVHSHEATVTAPTCTEAGYTTYTCSCGDSYTADEVESTGHSYADGVCGTCGAVEVKVCSVDENCEADTHEAECPMGPCTLTEGCSLAKGHVELGVPCDGMIIYEAIPEGSVLPDGVTMESFGDNTVTDGTNYYATMVAALEGIHLTDKFTLYCKPNADVGSMTHGHVCRSLTVFGNGARISGGEQEFEIDQYKHCHNGANVCNGITGDLTLTVQKLDGAGAWGTRTTTHTVNLVFEGCENMGRIYMNGTTGTTNITVTDCTFTSNTAGDCKIYSNANGEINLTRVNFSNVSHPVNLNHKVAGVQKVNIADCTFTNCGISTRDYAAPVRVLSSVDGAETQLNVSNATFAGTVPNNQGQSADILLDYGTGTTTANISGTAASVTAETADNVGGTIKIAADETKEVKNTDKLPNGKLLGGLVNMQNTAATFLTLDLTNVYAEESIVIEVFDSNGTLLATTSLSDEKKTEILGNLFGAFSSMVQITSNDPYWNTKWETDKLRADYVPAKATLFVDGQEMNTAPIQMRAAGTENAVNWADVPGVPGVPVAQIGDDKFDSLEKALDAAEDGDIVELLADVPSGITISKPITLVGNGKKVTGDVIVKGDTTFKGDLAVSGNVKAGYGDHSVSNMEIIVDGNLSTGYFYLGNKSEHYPNGGAHKLTINSGAVLDAGTLHVRTTGVMTAANATVKAGDLYVRGTMIVDGCTMSRQSSVGGGTGHWAVYEDDDATKTASLTLNNSTVSGNYLVVGSNSNGESDANSNAVLTVNGGSLTLNKLYVQGKADVFANNNASFTNATVDVDNVYVHAKAAMNVSGESVLNIASLSGNSADLQEGAIIKNSSVGGTVYIAGNVTFRGNNTFEMITDYGDYYSKETPSKWTVEQGGTLTLTKTDRYGLGYGDQVTVDGATVTMDGGLVGMTNSAAPNAVSTFTAQNSTLSFGVNGDKSFGNKPGNNYYGNYEFNFSKSTVTANAFKFYEDQGKTTLVSTDTNWNVNGVFMTNDSNSKFTFTNATIVSSAASNGSDDKNQNAGELTLDNTALTYNAAFTNVGTVVLKNGSKLSAPSLVNNGTITVDASGYQTGDVVIELTNATPSAEMVTVTGAEGAAVKVEKNKLVIAVPVAKVGDNDYYTTLKDALDNAAPGATVTLMKDITVNENWDCRYTGTKLTKEITIDGAGHTMTFTGTVIDENHFSVFRFEAPATVKNLNIDMSQCTNTGNMRAISTKADLIVENCHFIGNTTAKSRAIIFGEGSGAAIGEVEVKITGSTFTNWKRGLTDNENGQDVKSVEVTGNTFTNAGVQISAEETLTFTGNTVSGAKVSITTYSKPAELVATATGNTLDAAQPNTIKAAVITAQPEFTAAVVAKIGSKTYGTLQAAVDAVQNGETIVVQTDITDAENVVVPNGVTFTLDLNEKTFNGSIKVSNADLTVENGKIVNTNSNVNALESTGTLTVTNVDITSARAAVRVEGGKATLTGGTYRTNNAGGMTVNTINVSGNSKVTVENVTAYGPKGTGADAGAAVASRDTAAVTIKSGNFSGGVLNTLSGASKNNIVVTGGTYDQNPGEFCEDRYAPAYDSAKGTWSVVEAAASVTGADNVPAYYPTVADAVKATDDGETLTIIADRKDSTKDTSVTKTAAMNIAANDQGGVTVTANVPANSKYVEIPVKGVTYRVGAYGDLTISANGVIGGDNVEIKNGKPVYTLNPLNSQASYLSGSNATLTFESNMIFATFTKAYIDGSEITLDKDYVATPGSTIIELANARLRRLSAGKHTLMIKDDSNNTVSCDFHVTVNANADPTNPKTGDSIYAPMFVMISTAAALAVLVMGKKKHA